MKSVFIVDDNGQGMEKARSLLVEQGYSVCDSGPDTGDAMRFTQFAMDRACIQIFWLLENGRLVYVNEAACRSLGYGHEELTGMSVYDIAPYCTVEEYAALWRQVRKQGDDRFEAVHQSRDGRAYPVEIQSNFVAFEGREYCCCFVTDISERKLTEEKLLLHEFCVEKAGIGIFQVATDGEISMVNEQACQSLGYSSDELCAMTVFDIDPAITRKKRLDIRAILDVQGCATHETIHRRRDGTTFPVEITSNNIEFHGKSYTYSFAKDISERKLAEQALRENERIFRLLTEISPNAIILIREERIEYANPAAVEISGLSTDELAGTEFWRFIHEEFRDRAREQVLRLQRGEIASSRNEYLAYTGSGEERWFMASSAAMEYGGAPAIITTLVDITETKRTEAALRESEARLKLAMDVAKLVQWEFDATTGMFLFDEQFYTLFGTSTEREGGPQMPVTVYMRKFVHPDDIPTVKAEVERCLTTEEGTTNGQMEHRIVRTDGKERFITVRYWIIRDSEGRVVRAHGVSQDISERQRAEEERKKLETQLHHVRKMEAVGQLAGCIAHDFNNILTAIMGFAEIMLMKMGNKGPFLHHTRQIMEAGERAAELTQGLLAFSRKQVLHVQLLDPGEIVDGVKKMLRRLIPEDIDFRVKSTVNGMTVMADRGQIEQVLMNLVTNARDAMHTGGVLTLESGYGTIDQSFMKTHGFGKPGAYAMLSIADTGVGMDRETQEKIFEPFFTTKKVGKGTGLGLSIIYGIVKQHDGFITVDSTPGQGTTFRIYLPLVNSEREEMIKPGIRLLDMPAGGTETVLLAEDDDMVREMNRAILEEAGYTVIEAVDGQEALDMYRENRFQIDILVTDLIMPNIGGKRLFEEIRIIRPDAKFLFMSGYAEEVLDARGGLDDKFNFMPKPVMPSELLKKLRELLDRH